MYQYRPSDGDENTIIKRRLKPSYPKSTSEKTERLGFVFDLVSHRNLGAGGDLGGDLPPLFYQNVELAASFHFLHNSVDEGPSYAMAKFLTEYLPRKMEFPPAFAEPAPFPGP
eukprot:575830-Prorocentrum_minimum.AAC.5